MIFELIATITTFCGSLLIVRWFLQLINIYNLKTIHVWNLLLLVSDIRAHKPLDIIKLDRKSVV